MVMTTEEEESKTEFHKGGEISCWVPQCYNNSKRHKNWCFYVIPEDKQLNKLWLNNIKKTLSQSSITVTTNYCYQVLPTIVYKTSKINEIIKRSLSVVESIELSSVTNKALK